MLRCTSCGGNVDQLTDARRPLCSTCRPQAAPSARDQVEATAMDRVAASMRREAAIVFAAKPESTIAADLEVWADRMTGAAELRREAG
jgi:hypothetical protein